MSAPNNSGAWFKTDDVRRAVKKSNRIMREVAAELYRGRLKEDMDQPRLFGRKAKLKSVIRWNRLYKTRMLNDRKIALDTLERIFEIASGPSVDAQIFLTYDDLKWLRWEKNGE